MLKDVLGTLIQLDHPSRPRRIFLLLYFLTFGIERYEFTAAGRLGGALVHRARPLHAGLPGLGVGRANQQPGIEKRNGKCGGEE